MAGARRPTRPLSGYEIIEITVGEDSPILGCRVSEIDWPPGARLVALTEEREIVPSADDTEITAGETLILLAPTPSLPQRPELSLTPAP